MGLLSPVEVKFEMKDNFLGKKSEFNLHKKRENYVFITILANSSPAKVDFEMKENFWGKFDSIYIESKKRKQYWGSYLL